MRRKQYFKLFLAAVMLVTLVGCGKEEKKEESGVINYDGAPNVTANSDMKWIDSEIYGAIDSNVKTSEKDDFFTAVNKDWLLEQSAPTRDHDDVSLLMEGDDIVKERLLKIVSGEADSEAFDGSQVDIAADEITHNQDLVVQFVQAAADWDGRNAAGVTPLKVYIDDINSISSIDELTEYMIDIENRNVSQECLLEMGTMAGLIDAENYRCMIEPSANFVLNDYKAYTNFDFNHINDKILTDEIVVDILKKLGIDEKKAKDILIKCYRFEGMLIDHTNEKMVSNPECYETGYTLDEVSKMAGNFPFEKVFKAYGYTINDNIRLADKGYLRFIGSIYNDSHLELLKSYLIVHTINANILMLDRDTYDRVVESREKYTKSQTDTQGQGDVKEVQIKDDWDLILNKYAMPLMGGPLNVVYISRYCSLDQKNALEDLVDEIVEKYHQMIKSEEWMSDKAKDATIEKLDYMTLRVLYPDKLESFMDLQFEPSDDLVAMVQKINAFNKKKEAKKANQPVDRQVWDLAAAPTTVVNAYYKPDDNSINIFAGIISGDNIFNLDNPDEVNMARIGTIVGHEISHAFDSNGCFFDKYGYKKPWWDFDDLTAFQLRVTKLSNYYSGITPYPGAKNLTGNKLSGEAIADMGGMKIMLTLAKDKPEFDYDLFFRSYGELWRVSRSLGLEMSYVQEDVHPLNFLRTNITVSQYDEFIDTYGLSSGDGMYVAPNDRICVW